MEKGCDIPEIFADALELPPAARGDLIRHRCADDADAAREVEMLLGEHDEAARKDFLSKEAVELIAEHIVDGDADQRVGQTMGRYRILKRLGAGGMGTIYVASRCDDFEKQAAVKIIKRGMDTEAILGRFYNERQILATLEHPNIARLIDGGTTDDGLPFFVMEYVDGIDIRQYCSDLTHKEVLRIFLRVCSAVSFAHQKLVVHRDLKPSNILVNGSGEPKLLDFGIAKVLTETEQEDTRTIQRMLTPAYASPEQISGASVSTSMDVYSLGKILHEIISSGGGKTDPDLRRVLETAQHEDLEMRYGSVERFADDIKRFLDDLPVSARKVSIAYTARKFARRNRTKVAFAALFLLTLVAGLAATTWKTIEARHERELAERRFENLRKLSDSFVTELHSAIQDLPGSLAARRLLLRRATEQLDSLAEDAGDNPQLNADLANAYFNLSSLPDMPISEKERILLKAESMALSIADKEPVNAEAMVLLANIRLDLGDTRKVRGSAAEGLRYVASGVDTLEKAADVRPGNGRILQALRDGYAMLGAFQLLVGNAQAAMATTTRTMYLTQQIEQSGDAPTAVSLMSARVHLQTGHVLSILGRYDEALTELFADRDAERAAHEQDPNDTSIDFYLWAVDRRIAITYAGKGDLRNAAEYAASAMEVMDGLRKASPRDIGYNRNSAITEVLLGRLLVRQDQPDAALSHYRRALELSEYVTEADPEYIESKGDVARAKGGLGHALWLTGQADRAAQLLRESLVTFDEASQTDPENTVLKRDRAETAGWAADTVAHLDPNEAEVYRQLGESLWKDLSSAGALSAADRELAAMTTH